jgi:long-chain fatty acid transport protein
MRQHRLAVSAVALLAVFLPLRPAAGSGFGLFQHGGRATGQAGAFTARASDPSALTYNPAAITRLPGLQLQAGLDFGNAVDEYNSASGSFDAHHVINFPPALYLSWRPGGGSRWALGLGLDAPIWQNLDWRPVSFPGRFLTRQFKLQVFELHPVVAYEIDDSWSFAGGVRYLYGTQEQGFNRFVVVPPAPGNPTGTRVAEIEADAKADVDALAWDLALHYAKPAWGWGLVLRSAAELEGSGDVSYQPHDLPVPPDLVDHLAQRFQDGSAGQSFDLPAEVRGGFWFAPYPELRIELDASYQRWSELDDSVFLASPDAFGSGSRTTLRNWDDTVSLRLGLEGDVSDTFALFGGVAFEPAPVPGENLEPGFPRGDTLVYAVGFSYNIPKISFDVGYSFHDHDNRNASGQELLNPTRSGSYNSRDQVWAASARWRF